MNRLGCGGGVPGGRLLYLCGIVHRAIGIMRLEILTDTIGAVGHPDPIIADVAYAPDVL